MKLSKLEIQAFETSERKSKLGEKPFSVLFNPESFSIRYESVFVPDQGVGSTGKEGRFSRGRSKVLALDLVIDGTGVSHLAAEAVEAEIEFVEGQVELSSPSGVQVGEGEAESVAVQVKHFLDACYRLEGKIHEPAYLRISWGKWPLSEGGLSQGFDCRLKSVDVKYTSFARNGAPLRAELSTSFVESLDPPKQAAKDGMTSPDLSHRRLVRAGDTLPLLCAEIYGSPRHHVAVARINELDQLRFLAPGQELLFPPTRQLEEEES